MGGCFLFSVGKGIFKEPISALIFWTKVVESLLDVFPCIWSGSAAFCLMSFFLCGFDSFLASSIRTISPCSFCIRCGHVANFVFRSDSEEETKGWLFGIQQWLATLNFGSRDEALVQSVLAVPRWWKKLRSKQSLAEYTQLV